MPNQILSPIQLFADLDGKPLNDGYVFVGAPNTNPVTNPITVYQDAALTIPLPQPMRTSSGMLTRNGAVTTLYTGQVDYSIVVLDRHGRTIWNNPDVVSPFGALISFTNELIASAGASMVGFVQAGTGAVPGTLQQEARRVINVAQFGALTNTEADQAPAIQLADAAAAALGWELEFEKGQSYYAGELYLSSPRINFNSSTFLKTSTTDEGFVNWGNAANKATGITDGLLRDVTIDANGQSNVLNLRLYGNHTRSKIRNVRLLNSDFYAFGVGALTNPGDKADLNDGLDIDGMYIESTRSNATLGWDYSMGLECFPGVTCSDWNIRNIKTYGNIINKIHAVIGLKLSGLDFQATSEFDPLSSGYFEINNCDNVDVDETCRFSKVGTTYWAAKIAGDRITGYGGTANSNRFNAVADQMALSGVTNVTLGPPARVNTLLNIIGASQNIQLQGSFAGQIATATGSTIAALDMSGAHAELVRLNAGVVTAFRWAGGRWTMNGNNSKFLGVTKARIAHVDIVLTGAPQPFAISVDGTTATDLRLDHCTLDGGTTWDTPLYVLNGGVMRVTTCSFTNLVTGTLLAAGSAVLTTEANNMINDVLTPGPAP